MSDKEIADVIYSVFPFTSVEVIEDIYIKSITVVVNWFYKGCEYRLRRDIPRKAPKEIEWRLIQSIVEDIARNNVTVSQGDAE